MPEADKETDFWNELTPVAKAGVKAALKQSMQGKGKAHAKVMKSIKNGLPNNLAS